MAGPGGGGSRGGGFSGGSFGGGGGFSGGGGGFGGGSFGGHNNGGSFGGSHHHGHHHHHGPYFGGSVFGRRRAYVGGGCGSIFLTVIIIGMFILTGAIWLFAEPGQITINGHTVYIGEESFGYDEGTMQDYANAEYKKAFGDYEGYEDNILLVFLANKEADGYYTIAWVGDNIKPEINEMFGEYTEYGEAMNQYINTNYYGYTLDNNLADVVRAMEKSIADADLGSSFNGKVVDVKEKKSEIKNYTQFDISNDVVNEALDDFTEATGIPLVIVIDMAEKVFGGGTATTEAVSNNQSAVTDADDNANTTTIELTGKQLALGGVAILGVIIAIVVIAVILIKKMLPAKNKKQESNNIPWEG